MQVVFLFYQGMTALDAIGPHEILSRLPNATTKRVALQAGEILTDSGLKLMAEYSIDEVEQADILVIPGAGNATNLQDYPQIIDWVKRLHHHTIWTTSICTGSLILGAAGILKSKKATTHWAAIERLQQHEAIVQELRVVIDGKIITAAGVSAGIDMALILVEKLLGSDAAKAYQLAIEYDPAPPFVFEKLLSEESRLVQTVKDKLNQSFE